MLGGVWNGLYWPSASDDPLPLTPLNGDAESHTTGINDAGIICGWSIGSGNHPVIWHVTSDANGNPTVSSPFRLPNVEGDALDLSQPDEDGTVSVAGSTYDGESSAGVLCETGPASIERWNSDRPSAGYSSNQHRALSGINNMGVACGTSRLPRQDRHAVDGNRTDFPEPATEVRFFGGMGFEPLGLVVGWVSEQIGFPPGEAAIWAGPDAKPVLLNNPSVGNPRSTD